MNRLSNEVIKFIHPETSRTVNEYRQEIDEAIWATEWAKRFGDKDINKFVEISGAGSSGSGRPGVSNDSSEPKKKLFG